MKLAPLLRQRCPRCSRGRVFVGLVQMGETCEECGLRFEREQGYFLGAMYFSYALAIAVSTPLVLAMRYAGIDWSWVFVACGVELVALAPWLFRYSRVIWLHFDHAFDPR